MLQDSHSQKYTLLIPNFYRTPPQVLTESLGIVLPSGVGVMNTPITPPTSLPRTLSSVTKVVESMRCHLLGNCRSRGRGLLKAVTTSEAQPRQIHGDLNPGELIMRSQSARTHFEFPVARGQWHRIL